MRDIRTWIILFFILRLYAITAPPMEIAFSWRQVTVVMAARNFLEEDANILFPRIDIGGEKSGITGMEFPFMNYLIYLFSLVFGYTHWSGRLINLIVSSIGIFYFYKLCKYNFNERMAFFASIALLASTWFAYSRKVMPDTFSTALVMMGLWYGLQFLERTGKFADILLYALLTMLGVLSKIPAGYLLVLLAPIWFKKDVPVLRKKQFALFTFLLLLPVIFWYYLWVPHLSEKYGLVHFFMGIPFSDGMTAIFHDLPTFGKQLFINTIKFSGLVLLIWGMVSAIRLKDKMLLTIISLSFATFMVYVFKSGGNFTWHSYYSIPFVPILALVIGYGLDKIANPKLQIALILIFCIEGIMNQAHDFTIKDNDRRLLNLEKDFDTFSTRKDLVLFNSGEYPNSLYFAHRKGWVAYNENIAQPWFIDSLATKGLKYVVILKQSLGKDMEIKRNVVLDNDDYRIYSIGEKMSEH